MRPTVRPFIIEFKNRSSRSTAPRPPTIDAPSKGGAPPSFLDVGVFTADRKDRTNNYGAAMKAAGAVFGVSGPAAAVREEVSIPSVPVGRILPCLIDKGAVPTIGSAETEKKPRRARGTGKSKNPAPVRCEKPKFQPEDMAAPAPGEHPATNIPAEIPGAATPDRERRSIQQRRLLDAALKAGEKWKRRLCKAAR